MNWLLFFLIIVIAIVLFGIIDNIRFNWQVIQFIDTANELSVMYNSVIEILDNGELDAEFQGKRFYLYVEEGDYKSFLNQVELAVCEVLDKYNQIDERYFIEMDNDLNFEIEVLYQDIVNIQNEIRVTKWKNSWK